MLSLQNQFLTNFAKWPVLPAAEFAPDGFADSVPWYVYVLSLFYGLPWLLGTAFWIWMLVECLRKDPDRYYWMWLLIIVPPIGSAVYFFARWLPNHRTRSAPGFLRKWTRGKEIRRLEMAAKQIGNAHQFVQWGEALHESGRADAAAKAFSTALSKEPDNLQALWGAAQIEMKQNDWENAIEKLRKILASDPQYKFGDVSLALGHSLQAQGKTSEACDHLKAHIKRWRHPEAVFRLATLEASAGQTETAREHLEALILDVDSSPTGIARKHQKWKRQAKRMLRALPGG